MDEPQLHDLFDSLTNECMSREWLISAVENLLTKIEMQNKERRIEAAKAALVEATRDIWDWTSRGKAKSRMEEHAHKHGWEATITRVAREPEYFGSVRGFAYGKFPARVRALEKARLGLDIVEGRQNVGVKSMFFHESGEVRRQLAEYLDRGQRVDRALEPLAQHVLLVREQERALERERRLERQRPLDRGRGRSR